MAEQNYPVESYITSCGKKYYGYKCSCGEIVRGYQHKTVKGNIVCYKCRRIRAKQMYREKQVENWRLNICEN